MKSTTEPLNKILLYLGYYTKTVENKPSPEFKKIYFLLNNIEILFLFSTFDYKLITRIVDQKNFDRDIDYKKACFIAMIIFEMWTLTKSPKGEDATGSDMYYNMLFDSASGSDYPTYKIAKRIKEVIDQIKQPARDFIANTTAFKDIVSSNRLEIEISKYKLDNIIRPLDHMDRDIETNSLDFGLASKFAEYTDSNRILPDSIHGGKRRIRGGDDEKLRELQKNFVEANDDNKNDEKYKKSRFLIKCLIQSDVKGAQECMDTLPISTVKIDSYKIIKTLPETTLIKLATVLGIRFTNDKKIEDYATWIQRLRDNKDFNGDDDLLDTKGEINSYNDNKMKNKKDIYKRLCIIHYIGNIIIDRLAGRDLGYSIMRAQNKAPVRVSKPSGPEVSYRTKNNFMNYRSNANSLSLNSNPIVMNASLYQNQTPEQLDKIKSGIYGGAPDAQLYSSNLYEKLLNQAITKYTSLGYRIKQTDLNTIEKTIRNMREAEANILDAYSELMNVLRAYTAMKNPSDMMYLTAEERKKLENAFNNGNVNQIKELKEKLDKAMKEKKIYTDNAKDILDIMFPWKKSLEKTMNDNTKELRDEIKNLVIKDDINEIKKLINQVPKDFKLQMAKTYMSNHDESTVDKYHVNLMLAREMAELFNLSPTTDPTVTDFINNITDD